MQNGTDLIVVYKLFMRCEMLFDYPLDSRRIGVIKVSNLCQQLHVANVGSIKGKFVLLPYQGKFAALPLQHTI